ncbi:hypothetical protein STCU_12375 [Strigomonas culicis]|uniref:Uncharacterized protein n=1 Tax=Strigomonas culicis TaxID=28005 RepID=S9UK51_9TRYP|nr:hypothetical protein STCU_12375 [Strigomonas culicis]|eukprot:EPY15051.1 hypothetical protein STCU_12375 [Strigomonas culicis]
MRAVRPRRPAARKGCGRPRPRVVHGGAHPPAAPRARAHGVRVSPRAPAAAARPAQAAGVGGAGPPAAGGAAPLLRDGVRRGARGAGADRGGAGREPLCEP